MTTERSDRIYHGWRESTEKFDYFILGVSCALCAYIGQGYRAGPIGANPSTLELLALLVLVLAAVAGFRRVEKTLQVTLLNHKQLHANEGRGSMMAATQIDSQILLNQATGDIYNKNIMMKRIEGLTSTIESINEELCDAAASAQRQYHLRNGMILGGFLLLVASRVWAAYV